MTTLRRLSIVQGDHVVVAEPDVVVTTLLGSCVAACLQDPVARVGGMNHFLLGEPRHDHDVGRDEMLRYGVHAMELLINAMMKQGAVPARLRAHLYGGARVMHGLGDIGERNAAFARRFMQQEGIAVAHCDLGGTSARRVEFVPFEGKARCFHVEDAPVAVPPPRRRPAPPAEGVVELF